MIKKRKQIQLIFTTVPTQFILGLLFFCLIQEARAQKNKDSNTVRVMSYNIHYGKGMDGVFSLENIANVIKKADPDIVGLQEIKDSLQAEELGRLTGMKVVFGPSLGRSNGYGDAILSKFPFEWVGNHSIPSASSSRYQAMAVDIDLSEKFKNWSKIRLINTHFDWLRTIGSEEARLATVDVIEKGFFKESDNLPAILTADINSIPDSPVLNKLEKYGWSDYQGTGPYRTIPSTDPTRQIDFALYRSNKDFNWEVTNFFVMYGEESSDHLPVVIDLVLKKKIQITPFPNELEVFEGNLDISQGVYIQGKSSNEDYLSRLLVDEFGVNANNKKAGHKVKLEIKEDQSSSAEGYILSVNEEGIKIVGNTEAGIFYGIQSLRQLLMQSKEVPFLNIKDAPAFEWRSFMLDEARYFQGKDVVKKLLDDMALLKINRFHWHLTNDSGWRIEIKSFPLLTEIGSRRDSSQINDKGKKWRSELSDHTEHKGFYTQEDIKEIIAYARERHITIIPEVSMPGHVSAAIASYPFLGTTKQRTKVPTKFGIVTDVLDVSSPQTIRFIHQVLKEVSELFPSDYIHIGGDEVKYDQWKESTSINNFMKTKKIGNYYDLQVHFTNEVSRFVADSLNKQIIGWNEILGRNVHDWAKTENAKTTLSKDAIIQFWKGSAEDLLTGVERGHKIINSDHKFTYLDYTYDRISLKKAYSFNPVPEGLDTNAKKLIIGIGSQTWGEWTPTYKEVEYQTYPRIAAHAETGWTQKKNKNFNRFKENIQILIKEWKTKGYNVPDSKQIF